MKQVRFQLETVTAAFVHGSSRKIVEPRASSLKGVTRYWFRAAAGISDARRLRDVEGALFGSTDHGTGVTLHVPQPAACEVAQRALLPQHRPARTEHRGGHRRRDASSPTSALCRGTCFDVALHDTKRARGDSALRAGAAALWIAVELGGIGQRARRGAGSLAIRKIAGADLAIIRAGSAEDHARQLEAGLGVAVSAIRKWTNGVSHGVGSEPPFPMFSTAARIQVVRLRAKEEETARAEVMKGLCKFKNAAFGLPYMRGKTAPGERPVGGRHASPLWIHIAGLAEHGFAMVQTYVPSKTLQGSPRRIVEYLEHFETEYLVHLDALG